MKNFTIFIIILCSFVLFKVNGMAAIVDETALKEGISSIDSLYDSEKASEKFREVIFSETAQAELKIRASFWLAYTYLFEGEEVKARSAIRNIFDFEKNPDYDYFKGLPVSISQNSKVMGIFNTEKELFMQGNKPVQAIEPEVTQNGAQIEVSAEKPARAAGTTPGKFLVGALITFVYIIAITIL